MALRYDGSALYEDRDIGMGAGGDFIGLGNPGDIRAGPDLPVGYAPNPSYFAPGSSPSMNVDWSKVRATQRPGYTPGPERTFINKNKGQSFIQQFGKNLGSVTANPFTALSIAAATTPTESVDDASVGTQTPEMPNAIVGQNPTGMGPDGSYGWDIATQSAKAGAPGLEPGGMTTEGEETVIDWATPAINYGYSYNPADRANYYSTTNNAIYGDSATDIEGAEEDDLRALALDPLNRGLGPIHGAYAERFNKGPSKAAEYLGLGPGSTYANLAAADHYADQGPEGWVQSDFVGNYNPLEAAGAQMHAVGSEAPSGGFSLGDVGGFLGGLFRY